MIQQRKAQRKENLAQKQSLFPVRANKKQFTVPHPLSGKLQVAWGGGAGGTGGLGGPGPSSKVMMHVIPLTRTGRGFVLHIQTSVLSCSLLWEPARGGS